MPEIPEKFDWVTARAKCSIHGVFKDLEDGVADDIKNLEECFPTIKGHGKFSVRKNGGKRFSVLRVDNPMSGDSQSVVFVLEPPLIMVYDDDGNNTLKATITLNNNGECRLRVGEEELNLWQFRRRALEALFFGPPKASDSLTL